MRSRWQRSTPTWIWPVITERSQKLLVFVALAVPAALLAYNIAGEFSNPGSRLGADPALAVIRELGSWAIRFLLLTLAVSTGRRRLGIPKLMRFRRMIGLAAFTYAAAHFTAYLWLLAEWDPGVVASDLTERPYIVVGFSALMLLVPLAVTSTNRWRRRLGRRWLSLHRLVYPAVILVLLHEFWLTKDDFAEPVLYLAIFAGLMGERMLRRRRPAGETA
jgi:sulfoxide reductase heme-binding subunit YedZ